MNHLRSCAGCSAHILTTEVNTEYAWCQRCRPKHATPFEAWAAALAVGDRVYVQPTVDLAFVRSEWLVRGRTGDAVTISVLGLPDRLVETTVGQLAQHCVARRRAA